MRSRDSKGRFIKEGTALPTVPTARSEKSEKKSMKGKYQDNKGRWHGSNGKYV